MLHVKSSSWFFLLVLFLTFAAHSQTDTGAWRVLPNSPLAPSNHGDRHDDVFFVNPLTGWVVNLDGKIYKTTDGGESWVQQLDARTALGYDVLFRSVGFANEQIGWAGNINFTNRPDPTRVLFETRNGGLTWTDISHRISGSPPGGLCGIWVVNEKFIYAVGRYALGSSHFIKSADGGLTWTAKDMRAFASPLIDVYFFDENTGLAIGGTKLEMWEDLNTIRGVVLMTTDGGETWQARHTTNNIKEYGWKISFPTRNTGYVSMESGERAIVLKTTDGGLTWQEIQIENHSGISGIGFVTEQIGWTGGHGAISFMTADGGVTWRAAGFGENINRFRLLGDTLGYAVGKRVYKYTRSKPTGVNASVKFPLSFKLLQNHPNPLPAHSFTSIVFEIAENAQVDLAIFDLMGRRIKTLAHGFTTAGTHKILWEGANDLGKMTSPGVYIYRLRTGKFIQSRKLVLLP